MSRLRFHPHIVAARREGQHVRGLVVGHVDAEAGVHEQLTEVASGLRAARLPMKLVTLLLFMTRETELLSRSYRSLSESVQLRGFRASMNKHSYQTLAAFISTLFIRAYARSRVLNEALILRGFSGHWPVPASGLKNAGEAGLLVLTIGLALLLLVWDFVS